MAKRYICNFNNLESNSWDVSHGVSLTTEPGNQHFIVLLNIVQATVPWHERCDLFAILDELYPDTLSDGRVGLFGFYPNLLKDDSFGVRSSSKWIGLPSCTQISFLVVFVRPSLLPSVIHVLTRSAKSTGLSHFSKSIYSFNET